MRECNLDTIRKALQDYNQLGAVILKIVKRFFAGGDHGQLKFTAGFLLHAGRVGEIARHATGGRSKTSISMKAQQHSTERRGHSYLFAREMSQASRHSGQ